MKAAVELKPELGGRNFDCPEGIKFVEIDADFGGISTLSCPHRELIAVTERLAPNVECLLHGNLPDSGGIGADHVAEGVPVEVVGVLADELVDDAEGRLPGRTGRLLRGPLRQRRGSQAACPLPDEHLRSSR